MNTERLFEITNGPSKDALFDACKYAYSKTAKITIEPKIAVGCTMPLGPGCGCTYIPMRIKDVVIVGIEHENDSGESFNLRGECQAELKSLDSKKAVYRPYKFKASYNTRTRKGTISFE